jgi:membrane-bound lytic murein transglycosylase F
MFRKNRHSAAWLGCAAGLLLQVDAALATTPTQPSRGLPLAIATAPASPGPLRVLAVRTDAAAGMHGQDAQMRMIADFARALGRNVEWAEVSQPQALYARLAAGSADVVIGPEPRDLAAHPEIAATAPVATERYVVFGRSDNLAANPLELRGLSAAMPLASPYWDYFERLRAVMPGLKLHALPNELEIDAPLRLVADGMVDVAVVAVTDGQDWFKRHPRVKPLFDLTDDLPLRWYVRRDKDALLANLNQFIDRYHAAYFEPGATLRDFAAIKQRGVLRVITRVEPRNYYISEGKPSGFELELVSAFAQRHGLRLEVRVAASDEQVVDWLKKGVGDLVTTRLSGAALDDDPALTRSLSYDYEAFATVSRRALPLRSAADLGGLLFAAPQGSAEYRALLSMRENIRGMTVIPVTPEVNQHTLLNRVADGMVDATVVPGAEAAAIAAAYPELFVGTSIGHRYDYRWTMRCTNQKMLAAVNRFLGEASTNGLLQILTARYSGESHRAWPVAALPRLSPYDPIVQRYADHYGFDWRLIAAQMYQESRFNPGARSPSGAFGLMQLMPRTAKGLGFGDLQRPDSAIHAGVKYLYELRNEFDNEVPAGERTWFALAAYNTGAQRVERARRLAAKMKLDPNRWTNNVELAMLELARPRGGGRDRRYGQAIVYVRAIQSLYGSYRTLMVSASQALPGIPPRA